MSPFKAAQRLAEGNCYVLPIDPATPKNPGSIVGKGWPKRSTRDADTIEAYWDNDDPPSIAIHTGRSGLVAFDLDIDTMPEELAWLRTGRHQASREYASDRGHYVFASTETFISGDFKLSNGTQVGEIRSGNTVIVVEPSTHAKASQGGRYRWVTTGVVPDLPEVARAYLTAKADGVEPATQTASREQVADFIESTANTDDRPNALTALVASVAKQNSGTRNCVRNALRIAAGESRLGYYPFARAIAQIERAARESYAKRGESYEAQIGANEFGRLVANAVGYALCRDLDSIRAEANRDYGSGPREFAGLADGLRFRIEPGSSEPAKILRNAPLDLRQLRTRPPQPISWLLPDVLARDSYVSLSAAPGTGKSVLTRAIAVAASLGRSAFDPTYETESAKVIYLDAENGQDWWRSGLDSMGAPLDLPNLSVLCYPDVGGLDTAKGAREFLALIQSVAAGMDDQVDLVVLDTVSRFIDGGENDADTWSQFYRLAIQPLRDQQVAVLRLDHLGKDADRGPRGSSHKLSDVDADFRMTAARAGSDDLTLTLGKRRRQHFAQVLSVRRLDDPLRHELGSGAASFIVRTADGIATVLDPDTSALVSELDRLDVDPALGRDRAKAAYLQAGGQLSADNRFWAAAVRFRKQRAKQPKSSEIQNDSAVSGSADDDSK
ncbi:AAA family ATPase [Mycobacterium sp. shizuoka-1]|uniref:AAA family ATPase n=1 Tax=Mycobacterium sp. shizuoka-1 TaxID=2039281 RepID=UPI00130473BB|nr:AAA family ATPase [Mycobacterium sp. shizuoka-1]